MAKSRAHIYLTGVVQGVFFRSFVRSRAKLLGISGWVMNTMDGCVEAVLEGEEMDVKEAIEDCRKGPPGSQVTDIRVEWAEPTGEFQAFEIRRQE
jgi:acylphosphatase